MGARGVIPSASVSDPVKQTLYDDGQVQVENHRSHDVISGNPIPRLIEVSEITMKHLAQKRTSLTLEVGIYEEK